MIIKDIAGIFSAACRKAFDIEVSPDVGFAESKFGDFSTNVAFMLAKELKRPPFDIAKDIAGSLVDEKVSSAEAVAPGFINLEMTEEFWRKYLAGIDKNFHHLNRGEGEKVQVEFISANPTGPLTLGNARGGFIGDVLSNVLNAAGYEVTKEYYFNDAGTQISKLATSVWQRITDGDEAGSGEYSGPYLEEVAARVGGDYSGPEDDSFKKAIVADIFDCYIKPALQKAGIEFDVFTNERDIKKEFPLVRQKLEKKKLIEERDEALWLKSTAFGDDRDRVLIKSNGDHTYLANDIAYHYDIFFERGFERAIKIWGSDHAGQIPSLKLTLQQLLDQEQLEFVVVQWVRLIKDGKEFKISKRAGTYVTVDELVEQVGTGVARWFMLMRSNDTHMDFDLDLAREQSQKNPFWYVMYAYVRLQSIIKEAAQRGMEPGGDIQNLSALEKEMAKSISALPSLVEHIAASHEVHKLTFFGQELAKSFHDWYEQTRVIDLAPEEAASKLLLLVQVRTAFESVFELLGIEPYQQM